MGRCALHKDSRGPSRRSRGHGTGTTGGVCLQWIRLFAFLIFVFILIATFHVSCSGSSRIGIGIGIAFRIRLPG